MIDEHSIGLDRDLLASCSDAACASIVVTTGFARRDWVALGADRSIDSTFNSDELLSTLRAIATPIEQPDLHPLASTPGSLTEPLAPLIAVTGGGGTGRSTVAIALAQSLPGSALVDGSLHASLALMIGDVDVVPALQELVEAHRAGSPGLDEVRAVFSPCNRHGFDLLPGLRRHRDWTSLRPRAVEATVRSVRKAYPVVVADIDADVEGESDTGSFDIGDRNSLARTFVGLADSVVVTGRTDLAGLGRLVNTVTTLIDFGVDPGRILPLVLRPARCPLSAAEIRRSIATLLEASMPKATITDTSVVELPRDLDNTLLDGAAMPASFVEELRRVLPPEGAPERRHPEPANTVALTPGELGIAS
jgi:MinD-like ATPase involved in chromosome partitioning or flagellar assembly